MQHKGIYSYKCQPCSKTYVGETARSFSIRHDEHMKAARAGKWSHSGLTQHMQHCDGPIKGPEILSNMSGKSKSSLKYDLRIKEALFIRQQNCGPNKGLNEDMGSYVTTTQWAPVFNGM